MFLQKQVSFRLKVVAALEKQLSGTAWKPKLPQAQSAAKAPSRGTPAPPPPYAPGGKELATRQAFGEALAALGDPLPKPIVTERGLRLLLGQRCRSARAGHGA